MPRLRSIIKILIAGLVGGAIGYSIGAVLEARQQELTVAGFAFGALVAMWHNTKQRRWLIVGMLVVLYVLSYIEGGVIALLSALGATTLTFILSAVIVRHLYPGGEWEALVHHLKLALGLTRGFLIIQDGKIVVPAKSKGPLLGPHNLIIKPYYAATLERANRQSRIVGPDYVTTDPFEYVKNIIPIGRQQESFDVAHVLSKDCVPVTVTLNVTYHIDLPDEVVLGTKKLNPAQVAMLQAILLNTPDWKAHTRAAIKAATRKHCFKNELQNLLDPDRHANIQAGIQTDAQAACVAWHVVVGSILLENVQPPPEIKAARTSLQVAVTSGEIRKQRAAATHDALIHLAGAYQFAKANGMSEDDINRFLTLEYYRELNVDENIMSMKPTPSRAVVRLILDRDIEDLNATSIDELITTIAVRTQTERKDISVLYIIPGSVRLVVEMSNEGASRLLDLYVNNDPMMDQFDITAVNVARHSIYDPLVRPLLDGPRDIDIDHGLGALRDLMRHQPVNLVNEFATLEMRLKKIDEEIRTFGGEPSNRSQYLQAISALNELANSVRPGVTFTDLCRKRAIQ